MKKMTGLVMQINRKTLIILTKEGEFKEVPLPGKIPRVGEEVSVFERPRWTWSVAAAIIFFFLSGILGTWALTPDPVACLALDINPSLEIFAGFGEQVIAVRTLNSDAEKIVKDLPLKGTNIYDSLEKIIDRSITLGYVNPEKQNLIAATIIVIDKEKSKLEKERVEKVITDELYNKEITADLGVNVVSPEVMKQAKAEKLSINKFLVVNKAKVKGKPLDPGVIKKNSIRETLKNSGLKLEDVFSEVRNSQDMKAPKGKNDKLKVNNGKQDKNKDIDHNLSSQQPERRKKE